MIREKLTEDKAKQSPAGGVVVGKRDGQTMIYDDASVGGYFVGKLHSEGGIKMINKSTGQPLEVQGAEVIITAPAVADQTKREFEGRMMTNREILSEINKRGGGVSFAEGGNIPTEMQFSGNSYKYGGKTVTDHDIAYEISKCGCEHETLSEGGKIDEMPTSIKKKIYTADGERKITPVAISILTNYVNSLPQTKELNTDSNGNYTKERQELHQQIIDGFKDELICIQKDEPIAILMGGSPASGKSTFLRKYAPYLLKEEILKVDADEIRSMLPEYKGYNASQTHLETKDIVNTLLSDKTIGIPCKYDVIYDGTMNSTKSYLPLISLLKSLGYKIFIVYIDKVPEEVVKKRALERYKKSGRFVPMEIIDDFFSKGKTALEELKSKADGYMIIDGSSGDYNILEKKGIRLPKKRLYSKLGEPLSKLEKLVTGGHLAKGMSLKKIAKMHGVTLLELNRQVKMGLDAESEHTSNVSEQLKIVKDHLYENPNYYTLLKKAGLKKGGEIKESLVKDAKSGNSPSRDLNNYNDLMDVEADGAVGGDSGVYANGGALGASGLPLVDYIEITNTGSSLNKLENTKCADFKEFKNVVLEAYKAIQMNPKPRSYVNIQCYDSEGNKLVSAISYISDQKNTVKNFNPYTGNASNLEKSLSNSRPISFKKYDWSEWFSGKKSAPSTKSSATSNLVSGVYISYTNPTNNSLSSFTVNDASEFLYTLINLYRNSIKRIDFKLIVNGKILDETLLDLNLNDNSKDNWRLQANTLNPNVATLDDVEFRLKKEYLSFFDLSQFIGAPSTAITFTQGEIDMFADIKKYVVRNGLRVSDMGIVKEPKTGAVEFIDKESNKLHRFLTYSTVLSFERGNAISEEIIKKYLQWESSGASGGVSAQPTATATKPYSIKKPIDLKNTKIWVGDNPELSYAIQERAMELGFDWYYNGSKQPKYIHEKGLIFGDSKDITFASERKDFDIVQPHKEIFESDFFENTKLVEIPDEIKKFNGKVGSLPNPILELLVIRCKEQGLGQISDFLHKDIGTIKDEQGKYFGWANTQEGDIFWSNVKEGDFRKFKKLYGIYGEKVKDISASATIQPTASTSTQPALLTDLSDTKIWIDDNPELSKRVQERAFELGWDWSSGTKTPILKNIRWIVFGSNKKIARSVGDKAEFDNNQNKEIFTSDLFGSSTTTATTSTSTAQPIKKPTINLPFDLEMTKIWIGDNPELSRRVQERAMELGWDWWSGNKKPANLEMPSLFFNDDEKITGSDTRESFDSFKDYKEIFESDFFGSGITTAQPSATQSSKFSTSEIKLFEDIDGIVKEFNLSVKYPILELYPSPYTKDFDIVNEDTGEVFYLRSEADNLGVQKADADLKKSVALLKDYLDWLKEKQSTVSSAPTSTATSSNDLTTQTQPTAPLTGEEKLNKEFVADYDPLRKNYLLNSSTLKNDIEDLNALATLLPSFQQSKFAVEKATILKEMGRLQKKIDYKGFIASNESVSKGADLFTPQGLLKYYFTQTTQNPTAELQPPCELPTPNGAKSKLPLSAYLNVRSSQFKKWFGDWERAYETGNYVNCSKMIDEETKEPKIFYHGVRKYIPSFGQMSNMGVGVVRPYGSFEPPNFPASYFADNESYANFYGGIAENMPKPSEGYKPFIYKVFMCVKNPISLLPLDFEISYKDLIDYILVAYGIRINVNSVLLKQLGEDMNKKHPIWVYIRRDIGLIETLKDYGYDALIQQGDIPVFDESGNVVSDRSKFIKDTEYLSFYPNQIKSATVKKSFYFNFFNDIRFKKGGYVCI